MAKIVTSIAVLALFMIAMFCSSASAAIEVSGKKKWVFSKFLNKTDEALKLGVALPPKKIGSAQTLGLVLALQKCSDSAPFTIHGLWPTYSDGSWPSYCTNAQFDQSQVSDLWATIQQDWMTCPWGSDSENEFIAHEWTKHGTCANGMSEHDYFSTTLSIYEQGDWKQYCDNSQKTCQVQVQ